MNIEDVRIHCLSLPMVTEDMPFGDDYVTFRIGGKIFCGLALSRRETVQLKWNPEEFDEALATHLYLRQAWHWHKRHMIEFDFNDYPIPEDEAIALIDRAYGYVLGRLPKKQRKDLGL